MLAASIGLRSKSPSLCPLRARECTTHPGCDCRMASRSVDGSEQSTALQHSNLYVCKADGAASRSSVAFDFAEDDLHQLFSHFGTVESCIVSRTTQGISRGFALVKMSTIQAAMEAIEKLSGRTANDVVLEVRMADSDTAPQTSGLVPSDNMYVRSIPPSWARQDVIQHFASYGNVVDCRLLASTISRGTGALVRMANLEEATVAVQEEAVRTPTAARPRLQVRFADSPDEKRAKRASKMERRYQQSSVCSPLEMPAAVASYPPQAVLHGMGEGMAPMSAGLPSTVYQGAQQALQPPPGASTSIYIKNLPPTCDKLFLYERFAPLGAILSVKVLTHPATGQCRGVGFVNYASAMAAVAAVNSMQGASVAGKALQVSLQEPGHSRRAPTGSL